MFKNIINVIPGEWMLFGLAICFIGAVGIFILAERNGKL